MTRSDMGGHVSNSPGERLLSLVHVTDTHVMDAASPARAEWVELEAADPAFRPLLHMHRPYDTLTAWALHAHIETIRHNPYPVGSDTPFDLVVCTGDNIDNAQRNELDTYLALIAGGTTQLGAVGSVQDPAVITDVSTWPFWSPHESVHNTWREMGFPVVPDFVERVGQPIRSQGTGVPWTSVPGNHDLMRQGTALTNAALESIAVGDTKSLQRPRAFHSTDPRASFLDEPESFSCGAGFAITALADRRVIDRREWLAAHVERGALGYSGEHVQSGECDTIIDLEHIRLVLFDTNHPEGDFEGSVGRRQLAWLHDRLTEVDATPGRLAILVSHHGADTLINTRGINTRGINTRGDDSDRLLADDLNAVVHRHPCVVAWLVGHRHINRIEPRPGPSGGYWEITTSSTIDWPSQTRSIEVLRHSDGSVELACALMDHRDDPDGLASLHRDLARRFRSPGIAARMAGRDLDGDVRLALPKR